MDSELILEESIVCMRKKSHFHRNRANPPFSSRARAFRSFARPDRGWANLVAARETGFRETGFREHGERRNRRFSFFSCHAVIHLLY